MNALAIRTNGLYKTYRTGFLHKKFLALNNLNLEVKQGEILGYLGPNGAGKTTTFKIILDLIRPEKGEVYIWGKRAYGSSYRQEIGFLPDNPYFYDYLTPLESLDFYGKLFNFKKSERIERSRELLLWVGLDNFKDRQLRKFSRGMLQRLGVAQALINNPKILILDEPMLGLDPMGRRELRDIIIKCKENGKTVIFSTHILSDVEMICDRAAIIFNGTVHDVVSVEKTLETEIQFYEVIYANTTGKHELIRFKEYKDAMEGVENINKQGLKMISFNPHRMNLEDIFIKQAEGRINRWGK
ncbi:MAG: ABC transporter ATP-binding protein [Desulfobacterales bacterium]|nr:ABC transporter ATP-binding protein [Desulfobacterales bacterium]MBF0397396.1 ABC transporter ATP-binding protein [Desulfobacterales bacterium]